MKSEALWLRSAVLAGKVGEDEWALVRLARHNLGELADRVQAVEGKIQVSVSEEE